MCRHRPGLLLIQNAAELLAAGLAGDILEIGASQGKGAASEIRNPAADQTFNAEVLLVDFSAQQPTKGIDPRPQKAGVEWHIDPMQWRGCRTTSQRHWLWLLLRVCGRVSDESDEAGSGRWRRDVGRVSFELIRNGDEGVESAELKVEAMSEVKDINRERGAYIASTNVLYVLNVQVDNLQQPARLALNRFNNTAQGLFIEFYPRLLAMLLGLSKTTSWLLTSGYANRIYSTHCIIGSTSAVSFDTRLHGNATVENYIDQILNAEDVGDRRYGRVLAQRMTGKAALFGNEATRKQFVETCFRYQG